ncbi:MAG: hypothetical protein U1D55_13765 [Phycisphaerae bacterium]
MSYDPARDAVESTYARTLVRVKARQLIRRADFKREEKEDIEQTLWTMAVPALRRHFDPKRASLHTFLNCIVNRAVAQIIRDKHTLKRGRGTTTTTFNSVELDALEYKRDDFGRADAALDLTRVLPTLPRQLAATCQLLMQSETEASASRLLGVSRGRVRCSVADLRERFSA